MYLRFGIWTVLLNSSVCVGINEFFDFMNPFFTFFSAILFPIKSTVASAVFFLFEAVLSAAVTYFLVRTRSF